MTRHSFARYFFILILSVILACIMVGMTSCTSTKHFQKTENRKDSSTTETKSDSTAYYKAEAIRLESELKQLQYLTAEFDSTKCPEIKFPEGAALLNKDSVQRLVNDLNNALNGVNNKLKVNADGSLELSGRIKQFKYSNEILEKKLLEKTDSIQLLQKKLAEKKTEVKTEYITVEKKSKTKFLNFWWLLAIGIVIGWILRSKIKLTDMKKLIPFLLLAVLFTSCGSAGSNPSDYISWGEAFNHVSKSFSYWLWIIISGGAVGTYVFIVSKSKDGWNAGKTVILFVLLALLLTSIMVRPSEVAANTTVEQAARGVFIGY